MYLALAAFLLVFVAIAPASQHLILGALHQSGEFMGNWAPFSYIGLALLVAMMIASLFVLATAPKPVEPENPLAKYKNGADVITD